MQNKKIDFSGILFIFTAALVIRLVPLFNAAAWTDLYEQQAIPILNHLNIYSSTHMVFPYSPVSMFLPALCAKITIFTKIPFHIIMRFPAILADAFIALALYAVLSGTGRRGAYLIGLLYALNPVSILISSFHGNIITIPTLFSFLAYTVLLFGVEKNYRLSALLLGLAIGFRGYPVLLLPLFLIKLKLPPAEKIKYAAYAIIPTALSFIPFLLLDWRSVMREVFAYSGFPDYGIAAILRAAYSLKNHILAYGLPGNMLAALSGYTKILFLAVYAAILAASPKRKLASSILAVFVAFYFIYSGISSQYLIWVLPFAFLTRDRMLKYYMIFATWALVNFYWLYHPHIIFGKTAPIALSPAGLLAGEVISLTALWGTCLIWLAMLLLGKGGPDETVI
ncbi:MAG: hypothetical protein JXB40_03710 [Candidatus Omnitrophica bacterium]|nr:hypothetical protein [Candidatus Omnitrophota bacterium]